MRYSSQGDLYGHDWVPAECDVSIRPGWFWHSSEHPKSAIDLLEIYYKSVGRNCFLILNVPPNSSGLISDEDLQVLQDFSKLRRAIFSNNLAQDAIITANSTRGGICDPSFVAPHILQEGLQTYWAPKEGQPNWEIYLDLQKSKQFNVLQVQEPIQMGQRVFEFHLDAVIGGKWQTVIYGTTIGHKRLLKFPLVKSQYLRFVIDGSRADPLIAYFGIHLDVSSPNPGAHNASVSSSSNGNQFIQLPACKANTDTATL
uniref:Putative alpha-L-fucosidase 1 n=1 Tax=Anthurium amnicola TaxID=1678845 RepID=A0A1D1YGV1_9ARAE